MKTLLQEIRACQVCAEELPHPPRPVMAASPNSRIALIGQAPGKKVHESGVAWQDQSGRLLRAWLGIGEEEFYDTDLFAIIPMGFCYPGKGSSGDLPPRPECAPLWHPPLFEQMKKIRLTLVIGQYAQKYVLGDSAKRNLTETVRAYEDYLPKYFPLPHPSPRNRFWLAKNPWFADSVLAELRSQVAAALNHE